MKSSSFSRLSVYVDQDVHPIYEKLTSRSLKKAEDFPFETMKDLFIAAACIGAKNEKFVEVNKSKEIFDATLFNSKTEIPVLLSLAFLKTKDLETLSDERKIVDIAQGWANGGIRFIEDQILNKPGRPLFNFVELLWQEIESDEGTFTSEIVRQNGFTEDRDFQLINEISSKNFNSTDCADLLTILEIELRQFIALKLEKTTSSWWKQRIPNDIRQRAEKRKTDREEVYPGMEPQDHPVFDYLDFPDLKMIITNKANWDDVFKPFFNRADWIQVKLDEIAPFRNDIAHHRTIITNNREIFVSNARQIIRAIRAIGD